MNRFAREPFISAKKTGRQSAFERIRSFLAVAATVFLASACNGPEDATVASRVAAAHAAVSATSTSGVRYVRLQALSEVNGNPWTSMAEFNVVDPNGATISRAGWTVVADSQEVNGYLATNAIDGDPNTLWHTPWGPVTPMPHTFTVNMGTAQQVGGFKYLPRQDTQNGRIANYQFFTSADGVTWTMVAQGMLPNTAAESTVLLNPAPTMAPIPARADVVDQAITLAVSAADPNGAALTYSASGLPTGLSINTASGVISGTPTVVGAYAVTISATNGQAGVTGTFTWTIAAAGGGAGGGGLTARFVRLQAASEVAGNPWTVVPEFNLVDSSGALIPRAGWSASADSAEAGFPASNAIDGSSNSYWHTQYQSASPTVPHTLTINLGGVYGISGFRYLPRQDSYFGRIGSYRFSTSMDGTNWTLVSSGVFPNVADEQKVVLVAPSNHAPVISAVTDRSDVAGQPVSQAVAASDADGDALTYSATGLPTGVTINPATGVMSGTPTAAGAFTTTVTVGDGQATASTSFCWTITTGGGGGGGGGGGLTARYVRLQAVSEVAGNPWTSVAEFNLVDSSGALIPRAGWSATADSAEVGFAPSNAFDGSANSYWHTQYQGGSPTVPHTLTINLGNVYGISGFRYLPRQDSYFGRIGSYRFYTSTDGTSWTLVTSGVFPNVPDEQKVVLAAPSNHAPVVSAVANRTDLAGQPVTQPVTASDADGDPLTYSATGLPPGVTINAATGLMSGTPTASGAFATTVTVGDGQATASTSFSWTITTPNRPPVVSPVSARSDALGTPVTQAIVATDADKDPLTYSATGLPTGLTIGNTTGTITGTPTAAGTFGVTVTVSDGRANASTSFGWTITSTNHPPVITAVNGRVDPTGSPVTQPISATDADGDTLTYSASGLPAGLAINAGTGTIAGTPTAAGTFTVVVTVGDGRATASTTFTWLVTTNHPPAVAPISNRTDVAGTPVTQAVSASDADGDSLTYSATGLPTGLAINPATGTMSGTPTVAGTYLVMVTVGDGRSNSSTSFTWVITAAPSSGSYTVGYVRLEALSEINGNPWTSMAEFNLVDPNGATLSRSGWTVVADSQELVGENGAAVNAIDGDSNSIWHTQWSGANPVPPHTFTVNLGGSRQIGGFRYLPRQNGVNGRIANYRFYTRTDGSSWQLVKQGTFATDTSEQTIRFSSGGVDQPPTMATLPTRTDAVGSVVSLQVVASDPDGDALTFSTTGLPTGLSINAATGVISGTATQANTFSPTVSVSDGRGGSASQSFNWIISSSTTTPPTNPTNPTAPGSSGVNPPVVFNASTSAVAGDVVSLQGENFGTAPSVYFDGYPSTPLTIVDSLGTGWLAVQIPSNATGALILRIANGTGISAQIKLNAARPYHLDTTELHPGGAFRLFGRNLKVSGSIPTATVNGLAAAIDLTNSTEHLLLVTMPAGSQPSSTATILVDNGNGSGAAQLERTASIVNTGSGDPFSLGVGWGADFASIAGRTVFPATDARIGDRAQCNGSHDDGNAIQQAIGLASAAGGGVVQLPAGRCAYSGIITLQSNVVVRGAGKASTELYHTVSNYPVIGIGVDLSGLSDLTLTNAANGDGMLLKNSTRVFVKNVAINVGTANQMYLDGNVNFVFANTDVVQTGNGNLQGPYTFDNDRGLVFENNSTTWVSGAPTFGKIHDSSIRSSHFSRNATNQNTPGAVHSLTLDFAYRVSVIGNLLDVIGGPITNTTRNDGETILTEGGGANRTENNGTVKSATATTMTDTANTLNVDPFGSGSIPEDLGVAIVSGKGAGQMRHIVAYSSATRTATVDHAWDSIPDSTSRYATSVFGLEQALIEANTLKQNPRGIWLYNTSMRDVDVVGNILSENGGVYVRSYQNLSAGYFNAIYGVSIKGNQISNTTRNWMSYINVVMTNGDGIAFGTGTIGVEVRNNTITANRPNVYSTQEEYASTEGMTARMPLESGGYYESSTIPKLLGTIFDSNTCNYCDVAVRIGTGSNGTVINNTKLLGTPVLYTDTSVVGSGEKSTATVVR